jgi:hypothetical protein
VVPGTKVQFEELASIAATWWCGSVGIGWSAMAAPSSQ